MYVCCVCLSVCLCVWEQGSGKWADYHTLGAFTITAGTSLHGVNIAVDVFMLRLFSSCICFCMHTDRHTFSAAALFLFLSSTHNSGISFSLNEALRVCTHMSLLMANECVECLTKVRPCVWHSVCMYCQPA